MRSRLFDHRDYNSIVKRQTRPIVNSETKECISLDTNALDHPEFVYYL